MGDANENDLEPVSGIDMYNVLVEVSNNLGEISAELKVMNETLAKIVSFEGPQTSPLAQIFDQALTSLAKGPGRRK